MVLMMSSVMLIDRSINLQAHGLHNIVVPFRCLGSALEVIHAGNDTRRRRRRRLLSVAPGSGCHQNYSRITATL